MSSDEKFVAHVCERMAAAGAITSRKMFGEYAVYCGGKVVALICDNQLFVKPTAAGKAILRRPIEKAPYPGAKPHYLIDDGLDDKPWLSRLVAATAKELPAPKPKVKQPRKK